MPWPDARRRGLWRRAAATVVLVLACGQAAAAGDPLDGVTEPAPAWSGVVQLRAIGLRPRPADAGGELGLAVVRLGHDATPADTRYVLHVEAEAWRGSSPQPLELALASAPDADRLRCLCERGASSRAAQSLAIDWMYAQGRLGAARHTLGRAPINVSLGRLWSPADLYAPFRPGDLERLYKPGVDAAQIEFDLAEHATTVTIASLDGGKGEATRLNWLQRLDLSRTDGKSFVAIGQRRQRNLVAAGHQINGLLGADWYAELLLHRAHGRSAAQDAASIEPRGWGRRLVLGASFKPAADTLAGVELLDQTRIDEDTDLPFNGSGRRYAGAWLSHQLHPLVQIDALWFANRSDRSHQATLALKHTPQRNLLLRAQIALPLAASADTEYRRQGRIWQLGLDWYF